MANEQIEKKLKKKTTKKIAQPVLINNEKMIQKSENRAEN